MYALYTEIYKKCFQQTYKYKVYTYRILVNQYINLYLESKAKHFYCKCNINNKEINKEMEVKTSKYQENQCCAFDCYLQDYQVLIVPVLVLFKTRKAQFPLVLAVPLKLLISARIPLFPLLN